MADQGMSVRYAKPDDFAFLKAVDPWPRDDDWSRKIAAAEVVVAEMPQGRVGYLRFDVLWSTVPFLAMIEVLPEFRGQGLSRRLLEFLEGELKTRGYVALLSSSQTNEVAPQQWHAHMGFHSNGIIENIADDNIGEIVFRKLL